jgi:hypothetical protein
MSVGSHQRLLSCEMLCRKYMLSIHAVQDTPVSLQRGTRSGHGATASERIDARSATARCSAWLLYVCRIEDWLRRAGISTGHAHTQVRGTSNLRCARLCGVAMRAAAHSQPAPAPLVTLSMTVAVSSSR